MTAEADEFDGIICFGGLDWWYHNRGHYDLQMMRELSALMPVLYVNSMGMRMPKLTEGSMFVTRIRRKLKSLTRGLVKVRPTFGVFSPFAVPGKLARLTEPFVPAQIRRAARKLGIRRPLVWVAFPPAVRLLDALAPVAVVYQRTDRMEAFEGADTAYISACNRELQARADVTLFCATLLMEEERAQCRAAAFVDHGVDYDAFESAGKAGPEAVPDDVRAIPSPRVGFVGGIDAHTFDPELFLSVARALPDASFFLVGSCSLPDGWCTLPNVHLLGKRPYEEVPRYMAAADALIMPWNQSDWIQACNPVKLKEYLAVGRPIVSTGFHELRSYEGLVRVAAGADEFARELRAALASPGDGELGRARVRSATWAQRASDALAACRASRT